MCRKSMIEISIEGGYIHECFICTEDIATLCTMRRRLYSRCIMGPSPVIAIMKFKPQALLDTEMHFATINSLAGIWRNLNVA